MSMANRKTKAELKQAIIDEVTRCKWLSIDDDEGYYQSAYIEVDEDTNKEAIYILNEDNELGIDCYSYKELKRIAELIFKN